MAKPHQHTPPTLHQVLQQMYHDPSETHVDALILLHTFGSAACNLMEEHDSVRMHKVQQTEIEY